MHYVPMKCKIWPVNKGAPVVLCNLKTPVKMNQIGYYFDNWKLILCRKKVMHVFQRDQREVTLKSTHTFYIIPQFHQSMIIFTTSALKKIPTDWSTWRGVQKCSMRSSDYTTRRHQTAPDYLHGIWLLKKGLAWGPGWQCGARFVGMCLSGTTCTWR